MPCQFGASGSVSIRLGARPARTMGQCVSDDPRHVRRAPISADRQRLSGSASRPGGWTEELIGAPSDARARHDLRRWKQLMEAASAGRNAEQPAEDRTMPYADHLRGLFPRLELKVADLFALEAHQIAELPTRAPDKELAEVLHAHPEVRTFLEVRHPPIADHLTRAARRAPTVRRRRHREVRAGSPVGDRRPARLRHGARAARCAADERLGLRGRPPTSWISPARP